MTSSPDAQPLQPSRAPRERSRLLLDAPFEQRDLVALRQAVAAHADRAGLPTARVAELVVVASELVTNAIRHGDGRGRLRLWTADGMLHCQVTDDGPGFAGDAPVRPRRPEPGAVGGRGLWLVAEFCDALTVDSTAEGTTVTAAMALLTPGPADSGAR
ncbi:Anti-sigma regulatory factor (Ser/Thr protein kinase) [Micromonospora pattaloongensis]|uniref:Anti-sigma regulatory factor (Ser/Thr protein kinase) n=1 Tax=Micromonospora pattaloongensis TaxID=405436 RepID=A0A1H3HJ01_9ACTN|nr:ATP-binding protein [Micromonospora pattaloongensis]SDY15330.1 Anti-sigma regulatory factor (Ser/Thr protein kinase) [Micromonospora pattaloongensis]